MLCADLCSAQLYTELSLLEVIDNADLSKRTSLRLQSHVDRLIRVHHPAELIEAKQALRGPYRGLLGEGSNSVFGSHIRGTLLQVAWRGCERMEAGFIRAKAGEHWDELVQWSLCQDLQGLENLSMIPGTVGAAPIQNIGAYGVEVKDIISEVEVYDTINEQTNTFTNSECKFGYRDSIFKSIYKNRYIITYVHFKLSLTPKISSNYGAINSILVEQKIENPSIKDISNAVIAIRQSKLPDPKKLGNAGSFFKNPVVTNNCFLEIKTKYPSVPSFTVSESHVKIPAGWLIETLGWKGKTIGNCGVHYLQALVLVNYGEASGTEIFDLSEKIIQDVFSNFNIILEREVNIIE